MKRRSTLARYATTEIGALLALMFTSNRAIGRSDDAALHRWRQADPPTRAFALRLARRAFDSYASRRDVIEVPRTLPSLLRQRAGVFVSTMRHGAPRCCMGTIYPMEADAAHEIIANAVAAAGRDRRFPPIKAAELPQLTLIVSILGKPRTISIADLASVDPARDGLIVRQGGRTGVVLPGETSSTDAMLAWGRKRAGLDPQAAVELFQVDAVRWVEAR